MPLVGGVDGRRNAAVGEQLQRADAQLLVAVAGQRDRRGAPAGGGVRMASACGIISTEMGNVPAVAMARYTASADGAHAASWTQVMPSRMQRAGAHGDVLGPAVGIAVGRQRARMRRAPGPLDQQPGRLAAGVADDRAARRVGRRPADPERIERPAS